MKKRNIITTTALVFIMLATAQAANWINFSNFLKITQVTVNNNQVWVSGWGGLAMYDKSTGNKTFFTKAGNALPSLSVERVSVNPQNSNIWIGTYDNGIARFDGSTWAHYPFPDQTSMLYEMRIAANGAVWCATSNGLYKWENGTFTSYLTSNTVWDFDLFPNGKILCGQSQAFIFDPSNNQIVQLNSHAFAYSRSKVLVKNDSVYYFATDHGMIAEFNDTTEVDTVDINAETMQLRLSNTGNLLALTGMHVLLQKNGHNMDTVTFAEGNLEAFDIGTGNEIWGAGVGTGIDFGKLYHRNTNNQTDITDLRRTGIGSNWVYHIVNSDDNNVIITQQDSIQKFDLTTNTFVQTWKPDSFNTSFQNALELNGKLYVGTSYQYLYEYSAGQWNQLGNGTLPSASVDHLAKDKYGNLWMAGPGYLAKYDGTSFTLFTSATAPVLTPNLYVRDILCDSTRNTVWVATYSGIIRYTNGLFTLHNDTNTAGIQQYYSAIETIQEDAAHNIWFGTVYGGILKYDGSSFSTMLVPNTAGNQVITAIEFIGSTMYISDNLYGVWIYNNNTWDSLNVRNSEISTNAIYDMHADRNGNLWMSSIQFGTDVYNPNGVTISGIQKTQATTTLHIYPNPSTGVFFIETPEQAQISVYNIQGKVVRQFKSTTALTKLDLTGSSAGMYVANIKTAAGISTSKIIVQ